MRTWSRKLATVGVIIASLIGIGTAVTNAASSPTTTTTTTAATTTTAPPLPVVEIPTVGPDGAPIDNTAQRGRAETVAETLPPPPTTTTTTTTTIAPPPADALPSNSGEGRRVVYSKSAQRVWAVDSNGTVVKTHPVSGRRTWDQPKPGTYKVFSRSYRTCNINSPHICWRYMVRFTKGPDGDNIGFHEIPVNTRTGKKVQSPDQLGQALSAGCVRQAEPDAKFIWDFAQKGTKVVVLG